MVAWSRPKLGTAILASGILLAMLTGPASAAIETNPQALYAKMNEAYTDGTVHGWTFDQHRYYASAVYATGRSYSLFRHDDPNYHSVALLTVDIASSLNYDPLNSEDGASWWIREAANYAKANDPTRAAAAAVLLNRLDAVESSYGDAARIAADDAAANVSAYHNDSEARVEQVIVELRVAAFSADQKYLLAALGHAAQPNFPLVRLPSNNLEQIYQTAHDVLDNAQSAPADRANATSIFKRRDATPQLQDIGSVTAVRHSFHLSITAPADEYFGRGGLSVLGIRNLIVHLQRYLDAGYGVREAGEAQGLTDALITLQRTYPKDFELPRLLTDAIAQITRIADPRAQSNVQALAQTLIYNYPESKQAIALLKTMQSDGASAGGANAGAAGANDGTAPAGTPSVLPAQAPQASAPDLGPRALPDIAQHAPARAANFQPIPVKAVAQ